MSTPKQTDNTECKACHGTGWIALGEPCAEPHPANTAVNRVEINPDRISDADEAWQDGWQRAIDFNNKVRGREINKLKSALQRIIFIVNDAAPDEIAHAVMTAISLTIGEADRKLVKR